MTQFRTRDDWAALKLQKEKLPFALAPVDYHAAFPLSFSQPLLRPPAPISTPTSGWWSRLSLRNPGLLLIQSLSVSPNLLFLPPATFNGVVFLVAVDAHSEVNVCTV